MPRRIPSEALQEFRRQRMEEWYAPKVFPFTSPSWTDTKVAQAHNYLAESEGHPVSQLGKTDRDIGGNFTVYKRDYSEYSTLGDRLDFSQNSNPFSIGNHYRGGQWARYESPRTSNFPEVYPTSNAVLDAYGTSAIARILPTNPLAGLATFIGEAREGLPSIVGSNIRGRAGRAKSAGSEYLNVEFGWKPLVNDLKKFADSAVNSQEEIAKFENNSGKRIKRHYTWDDVTTTSVQDWGTATPVPNLFTGYYNTYLGRLTLTTTTRLRKWFSGCFTYYLPPFDPNGDNKKRNSMIRNRLYGTRLTPEVLWDLTPWTWAADWVGNLGDVFHNVSAFRNDGLVMPYGYVMHSYSVTHTWMLQGIEYKSYPGEKHTFTQSFTTTCKQRRKASPYGFGLNPAFFTGRRLAILAALGISRSGSQL
jgi:hypothetical protein